MSQVVMLDTGPLGFVTNPRSSTVGVACAHWVQELVAAGNRVIIPEIADYELRRELLRANKVNGLARLDGLATLTTVAMRQAAIFWGQARQQGLPTADDKALDADVILAAQAVSLGVPDVVIATTNVGHLSRFTTAALWPDIRIRS